MRVFALLLGVLASAAAFSAPPLPLGSMRRASKAGKRPARMLCFPRKFTWHPKAQACLVPSISVRRFSYLPLFPQPLISTPESQQQPPGCRLLRLLCLSSHTPKASTAPWLVSQPPLRFVHIHPPIASSPRAQRRISSVPRGAHSGQHAIDVFDAPPQPRQTSKQAKSPRESLPGHAGPKTLNKSYLLQP